MPEHPVLGRFFIFYSAPSKCWKNAEIMTGIDLLCPKEKSLRARFFDFCPKTHFFEKNFKKLPKLVMWDDQFWQKLKKMKKYQQNHYQMKAVLIYFTLTWFYRLI